MAVEKIYTINEINQINLTKKAIVNSIYTDVDGNKYIGTRLGTLMFLQNAASTAIDSISGIDSKNVQGAIGEINGRLKIIENDYVTEEELAASERRSRCFTLSMSMIL